MATALTPEEKRERNMKRANGLQETMQPEESSTQRPPRRAKGVFNGTRQKMTVKKEIPGHHLHWFNDERNRINDALDNGYTFVKPEEVGGIGNVYTVTPVNTDTSDRVRMLVGVGENGNPLHAYLMKIPKEWFDEDQAAIQEKNNLMDHKILSGKPDGVDSEGFYIGQQGISIRRK